MPNEDITEGYKVCVDAPLASGCPFNYSRGVTRGCHIVYTIGGASLQCPIGGRDAAPGECPLRRGPVTITPINNLKVIAERRKAIKKEIEECHELERRLQHEIAHLGEKP